MAAFGLLIVVCGFLMRPELLRNAEHSSVIGGMRLFIALDLPAAASAELAAAQSRLRLGGHPVRWADVSGLHLTLQFLGETPEEQVAPLVAALAALDAPPLKLALAGLGAFPNARRPRVLWAGVGGDTAALAQLQAAVLRATAPLGFSPEERIFRPHLTLGRVRQEARPEQLRALGEALEHAEPPASVAWQSGPPALFQSTLTPRGAIYTRLS